MIDRQYYTPSEAARVVELMGYFFTAMRYQAGKFDIVNPEKYNQPDTRFEGDYISTRLFDAVWERAK